MDESHTTPPLTPAEAIRRALKVRGWTQEDLAAVADCPRQAISGIANGKRNIAPDLAVALGTAFGNGADYWLSLESQHQLSLVNVNPAGIERRARLYSVAPIRDMRKRGWIDASEGSDTLEDELKRFFDVPSMDEEPRIGAATRKSDVGDPLTPCQRAWCFRVRQLAKAQLVAEYREDALPRCEQALRRIAAYPQEAHKVPQALASFGIRFVVVEPLPSSKVAGVALWLDPSSPVIGVSLRYDRNDSFWFTLFHELSHIRHRDEAPLDGDLTDPMAGVLIVKDGMERRADDEASDSLIPRAELDSFVLRAGPIYSKDRIIQFAHRMKVHPGIVAGLLHGRGEAGYSAHREMLAKIRNFIVPAAVTDGWGFSIDPRTLQ